MDTGWIKLQRKLRNWGWYKDVPVKTLFIELLLIANHETGTWQGREIRKGQCVTGRKQLSFNTGLSEQQVRTAMNKLIKTGEITIESTNKFTVITVVNYSKYQGSDTDDQPTEQPTDNQQSTNNQPTSNQQITTNKNKKNNKNNKNKKEINIYTSSADEVIDHLNMRTGSSYKHIDSTRKFIIARLKEGFTVQDCKDVIDKKCVEWMNTDMEKFIRPSTLFNADKFQNYLNARVVQKGQNVF